MFGFGAPNWVPLAGDWNGDGKDTVGVYNPASGLFYLVNTNGKPYADQVFGFGAPNWVPLAGDWDGDGKDSVGVYDPGTSIFYLSNTNGRPYADIIFGYGMPGWTPISGHWTALSCTPQCSGRECGGDGCGGSCGTCGVGFDCNASGRCYVPSSPFAKAAGGDFYVNGAKFFFSGANTYYLWYGRWNCATGDANQGCSKEVLDDAKAMNLRVMRVWGFSDGTANYWGQLQPSLGSYSEAGFQKFDRLLQEAALRGIKLIGPLVNNWDDFGGMCQYARWCGVANSSSCSPSASQGSAGAAAHDAFYTNACARQYYKSYVSYFLNRTNTLTGVKYKDDSTIFAWELANEPRAKSDSSGSVLDNWIVEMSAHIKSVDVKHMLSVGMEGFTAASEGTDFVRHHNHANIDYVGFHLLMEDWGWSTSQQAVDWINGRIDAARVLGKPVILEEIGKKAPRDAVLTDVYRALEQKNADGDAFWMLKDSAYPDYDGYGVNYPENSSTIAIIGAHTAVMNGK